MISKNDIEIAKRVIETMFNSDVTVQVEMYDEEYVEISSPELEHRIAIRKENGVPVYQVLRIQDIRPDEILVIADGLSGLTAALSTLIAEEHRCQALFLLAELHDELRHSRKGAA